jgi:serine/threonine protein kinase
MSTSRLGPFALEQPLGGAHSSVFRAIHVEQGRSVVVRIFPLPFGVGEETKEKFLAEAHTLIKLQHQNIVSCLGGSIAKSQAYLAFEYIRGESLEKLLEKRARLSWEQVVEIGLQICAGLEYTHEHEIIHQALSTERIFITDNNVIKVNDLRLERHGGLNPPMALTAARVAYLSPEQVTPDSVLTERTDVYALGCILYQMLTGSVPFVSDNPKELARMHREDVAVRITGQVLDCPVWLDSLVHQMLQKDPNRRPYTMAAVRMALKETQVNMAQGRGVAEHAVRGVSAIQVGQDREEARSILQRHNDSNRRNERRRERENSPPFYESIWFLLLSLVAVVGGIAFMMMPPSEGTMFRRGEKLLALDEAPTSRRAIDDHLRPMLKRFPNGVYAEKAQQYVDDFDMATIERRMKLNLNLSRDPENPNELRLMDAWKYQIFGDKSRTRDLCQTFLDRAALEKKDRPLRLLAEREITDIEALRQLFTSAEFVELKLEEARQLAEADDVRSARWIWKRIIDLYADADFDEALAESKKRLNDHQLGD